MRIRRGWGESGARRAGTSGDQALPESLLGRSHRRACFSRRRTRKSWGDRFVRPGPVGPSSFGARHILCLAPDLRQSPAKAGPGGSRTTAHSWCSLVPRLGSPSPQWRGSCRPAHPVHSSDDPPDSGFWSPQLAIAPRLCPCVAALAPPGPALEVPGRASMPRHRCGPGALNLARGRFARSIAGRVAKFRCEMRLGAR